MMHYTQVISILLDVTTPRKSEIFVAKMLTYLNIFKFSGASNFFSGVHQRQATGYEDLKLF